MDSKPERLIPIETLDRRLVADDDHNARWPLGGSPNNGAPLPLPEKVRFEFERLQSLIAKDGGSLVIEHARPIGQFPLKLVENKSLPAGGNEGVTKPRHLLR